MGSFDPKTWLGMICLFNPFLKGTALDSQALSSSTGRYAVIYRADRAGTISTVKFTVASIAGTSPTYRCSIQTVSGQNPTGTLWATNTSGIVQPGAAGVQTVTLTANATVAAGDVFAVVLDYSSGTINGSNAITVQERLSGDFPVSGGAAFGLIYSGSWTKRDGYPLMWCEFTTGDPLPQGAMPVTNLDASTFASNTTPDEKGIKFVSRFNGYLDGAILIAFPSGTSSTFDVVLYDSADNVLATASIDPNTCLRLSTVGTIRVHWSAPVKIKADSTYRITMKPTTTNTVAIHRLDWASATLKQQAWGWADGTTRVDGGAWTDHTTQVPLIIPIAYRIAPLVAA